MSPPLTFDPSIFPGDDELRRTRFLDEMRKLRWAQIVRVEDGVMTPGRTDAARILERIGFPADLRGCSVLDAGASDGAFAFECERRGAQRVVAFASEARPTLRLVHDYLRSQVEIVTGSVYLLDAALGTFDYVLSCGLLERCRYPALAVDRLRGVTRRTCFVESHVTKLEVRNGRGFGIPLTTFYERDELLGDGGNWTGPNIGQVIGWFRSAGFDVYPIDMQEDRATFRADAIAGTPPYLRAAAPGEYAGMRLGPT